MSQHLLSVRIDAVQTDSSLKPTRLLFTAGRDMHRTLQVSILACSVFAIQCWGWASAQEIGSVVLPKSPEFAWRSSDGVVLSDSLNNVPWTIQRIEGDRYWFKEGESEGWANAADVVLLEQAPEHFKKMLELNPKPAWPWIMRGIAYSYAGKCDEAIADFSEAITRDGRAFQAYQGRAVCYADQKDFERAIADLNIAIELVPKSALTFNNRAIFWAKLSKPEKALADFDRAIQLDPKYGLVYFNRGLFREEQRDAKNAVQDFKEAIRLLPESADARNALAWVYATSPDPGLRDGKLAVQYAQEACQLSDWKKANAIGTLAAALAEAGRFEEAIRRLKQAMELEPGVEIRDAMLKEFQSGRAFRQGMNSG